MAMASGNPYGENMVSGKWKTICHFWQMAAIFLYLNKNLPFLGNGIWFLANGVYLKRPQEG
jgi:hypothetical protein